MSASGMESRRRLNEGPDLISEFRKLALAPSRNGHLGQALRHWDEGGEQSPASKSGKACGPAPTPCCPACSESELQFEVGNRYACLNCGSRCIVDDQGHAQDFMPWRFAGRKRRSPRRRRSR